MNQAENNQAIRQNRTALSRVQIIEVGLRDGLQRESQTIPTASKVALIEALAESGVRRIQVTSFVHPKLVPQMADAEAVCAGLKPRDGVTYSGLVLNMKGLDRAYQAGLSQVDVSISASDTHSRKNMRRSLPEAREQFAAMVSQAHEYSLTVRGGIQCAFGCVYEGQIDPGLVIDLVEHHLALGVDQLALADSTGMANPWQIRQLLQAIQSRVGTTPIILHLHDTYGMGLANVLAAVECGVTRFDTALGGLGGCPFIEGATGNIATEDTIHMLNEMGIETGIDIRGVSRCSRFLERALGRTLPGKLYRLVEAAVEGDQAIGI
jgi:hydroxymethylglutaryl-CoA lyase